MVGIILAAGNGTRLKSTTGEDCCKALKKINDICLIEFALGNLLQLGIEKVCIVIGKQGDLIKNAIGDSYKGIKVSYALQKEQRGLINAFVQGVVGISDDEDVILQLADEVLSGLKVSEIKSVISALRSDFYCGVTYEDNPQKIKNNFSVDADEDLTVKWCTEKPEHIINKMKGTGFCIFNSSCVQMLKGMYDEENNTPDDLCDYMNSLISEGKKGTALVVAEQEFNINTASDLKEVLDFLGKN